MANGQVGARWLVIAKTIAYDVEDILYRTKVMPSVRLGNYKIIRNSGKYFLSENGETVVIPRFTKRVIVSLVLQQDELIDWQCEFPLDATTRTCYRRMDAYVYGVVAHYMKARNPDSHWAHYGPFQRAESYVHHINI